MLHHDIRSALADVMGGLDLIDDRTLSEGSRVQMERVRAAAAALGPLIDEAVFESSGDTPFAATLSEGARVPLIDLLRSIERRWSGLARAQGLTLVADIASDLPILIDLDGRALERILSNLLSNAMKYAERGTITLAVNSRVGGDLRFVVSDEGPGFSDGALARLFEYGGRPADSLRPGTGVGLHICKSLADALGGHLEVTNGALGGAQISLVLPKRSWRATVEGPIATLPDLSGHRVLLAEDNPTNQTIFRQMLEHMGAQVCLRENGRAAYDAICTSNYDIAVVDIEMPIMSGTELIEAVRQLSGPRARMPILAVTAYVLRAYREDIYRAGADGIVAKPVESFLAFGEALRALIEKSGRSVAPGLPIDTPLRRGPVPSRITDWEGGPAMSKPVDDRLAHLLTMAGPDGRTELLRRLETDLTRVSAQLSAAEGQRDRAALRSETHVLISLAGAVGADGLQHLAQNLNSAAHGRDPARIPDLIRQSQEHLQVLIARIREERDADRLATMGVS